eukprot:866961_1
MSGRRSCQLQCLLSFPNVLSQDAWHFIFDMGLVVKKKKAKSSVKEVTMSSKKRKAETKSDGKIEVKVKVTISEEQPPLVANYNERDIIVRLAG